MKQIKLFFLSACIAGSFFSVTASEMQDLSNKIELLSATENESVIHFTVNDYRLSKLSTPWGESFVVEAPGMTPILKKGAPALPKFTTSLIIPDRGRMAVEVVSSEFTDYPNTDIVPSKGNLTRDVDPKHIPYEKGSEYSSPGFYPSANAELREPYILRDLRGQAVVVHPFQYDPSTKTLRVFSKITIRVFQEGNDGHNPIVRSAFPSYVDPEFNQIYQSHFLNKGVAPLYTPVGEYGKMLVICGSNYMSAIQPFVDWKIRTGIQVELVNVSSIGTNATAIKNYVLNKFNAGGLTFLLLVGDAAQIPPVVLSTGDSDNGYAYLAGSDNYPDILVGRFSAESAAHVTTQVDRIIKYEKYPQANGTWYSRGVGIASDQGPGDDNEYDYQHERNIRTQLLAYTYASVEELYDGSQGGNDASGNPSSSMLSTIVNSGVSVINYTGHGSQTSWVTTGFNNTAVNALNNADAHPFVWSVGCVNGDFNGLTCFAETWLRATDNSGAPAGALSMMASTINQSWDPPMEAQDEFNAILTESYSNNIKRSFGGISMNGCAKMNDTYGSQGTEMTDTWVLFGDPSVMVRTDTPMAMTASHVTQELVGVTQLVVNCNVNDALVGLSVNNTWLGAGFVSNGTATITFPSIAAPCTIDVTVTAYNKMPYFGTVQVLNALGIEEDGGALSSAGLFPNPASDRITLTGISSLPGNVSFCITDAAGREGMRKEMNTQNPILDVSALENGIYHCLVRSGERRVTKKLVIAK